MTKHFAIDRNMFQGEHKLKRIVDETGTKQIDIIFGVYSVIEYRKNMIGEAGVTLRYIENFLYKTSRSRNIKVIKESLEILKQYEVVSYDYSMDEVKPTDMIELAVTDYEQYMAFSKDDFSMLKQLGSNFFLMFCMINNYHNDKQGYSYPSYDLLTSLMSRPTVSKQLDEAQSLGIYIVNSNGWDNNNGQARRSNNMYIKVDEAVAKVADMSSEDIQNAIDGNGKDEDNRYKSDKGREEPEDKPKRSHGFGAYADKVVEEVIEEVVEEVNPFEVKKVVRRVSRP